MANMTAIDEIHSILFDKYPDRLKIVELIEAQDALVKHLRKSIVSKINDWQGVTDKLISAEQKIEKMKCCMNCLTFNNCIKGEKVYVCDDWKELV